MQTTDVLLVLTILLLLCATGVNMRSGSQTYPVPCTTYVPRPCDSGFIGHGTGSADNFAGDNPLEYEGFSHDVDEMVNHPQSRGLVPKVNQPHHTKNLWKSNHTQPGYDFLGRRHTWSSSDLLTPHKDQHTLNKVNPYYKEAKFPGMGSTLFEDLSVHPYTNELDSNLSPESEKNPTIQKMLL